MKTLVIYLLKFIVFLIKIQQNCLVFYDTKHVTLTFCLAYAIVSKWKLTLFIKRNTEKQQKSN